MIIGAILLYLEHYGIYDIVGYNRVVINVGDNRANCIVPRVLWNM